MPRTHIKSITYAPKIRSVMSGSCCQTIRAYPLTAPEKAVKPGDYILFHGWEGKPYRSPWSWRLKVFVYDVVMVTAYPGTVHISGWPGQAWDSPLLDHIAKQDGISPATGLELKSVLERLNGAITPAGAGFQIIKWSETPLPLHSSVSPQPIKEAVQ